jgi:hypothetical protein
LADEPCRRAAELQLGGGQALRAELLLEAPNLDVLEVALVVPELDVE